MKQTFSEPDAVNRLLHPATENNTVTRTEQERPPVVSNPYNLRPRNSTSREKLSLIRFKFDAHHHHQKSSKGRCVIEHQPLVIRILPCHGNISLLFDFIIFILRKAKGNQPRNKPNSLSYIYTNV
jgi:hypothetical protein